MRQRTELVNVLRGLFDQYGAVFDEYGAVFHVGPSQMIRPPTLDRPKAEFSEFAQGDRLVTPPDFHIMIGSLMPIERCGRS